MDGYTEFEPTDSDTEEIRRFWPGTEVIDRRDLADIGLVIALIRDDVSLEAGVLVRWEDGEEQLLIGKGLSSLSPVVPFPVEPRTVTLPPDKSLGDLFS